MASWTFIHKWIVRNGEENKGFKELKIQQALNEITSRNEYNFIELEEHQELKFSLNEITDAGTSPLHLAVLHQPQLVFHLINNGINVNHQNNRGETALHWACHARMLENVDILLKNGAKTSLLDNDKNTILHWAAAAGGSRIAKLILAENLGILNLKNEEGDTALALACFEKEFVFAKVLLQAGAEYSELLMELTNQKKYDAIKILLRYGAQSNMKDFKDSYMRTPLHYAALHNHYRLVKLFSEYNPEWCKVKDAKGFIPFRFCHSQSDKRIVSLLNVQ